MKPIQKFTADELRAELKLGGKTVGDIAKRFGVASSTASRALQSIRKEIHVIGWRKMPNLILKEFGYGSLPDIARPAILTGKQKRDNHCAREVARRKMNREESIRLASLPLPMPFRDPMIWMSYGQPL